MTSVTLRKRLASNIRIARKKKSYSRVKLAKASGLSSQMIADVETCRKWPSDKTLSKIANTLDTDVYILLLPRNYGAICTGNRKLRNFVILKLRVIFACIFDNIEKH
jgi:transcriptional regulator with XRE-family HTH domain